MRQRLDYAGWYDPVKLTLKSVIDCQYMACMNPTAGSFLVNPRLQRHFSTFAVGMPSATSLLTIFQTFLDGHFQAEQFPANVCNQVSNLIKGHHVLSGPHYFMVCSSQVQCVRIGVQTSFPRQHEHTDVTWQASLEVCYSLAPMLRNLLYQIVLYFSGSMNLSELTAIDLSANQMSCDFGQSFKARPKRHSQQ